MMSAYAVIPLVFGIVFSYLWLPELNESLGRYAQAKLASRKVELPARLAASSSPSPKPSRN
jgi:hypothetical protein